MTEKKPKTGFVMPTHRGSSAIVPLLIFCCLATAFSIILGSGDLFNWLPAIGGNPSGSHESGAPNPNGEEGPDTETGPVIEAVEGIPGFEGAVVVGSYSAALQSGSEERAENIRLAADAINGYIINPGAVFSFNEVVGDVANDVHYMVASVDYNGELITGRGGGVSQVSSALYVAALQTNLKIIERGPHLAYWSFVPMGLDANVVYGSMDLVLANETDFPVLITARSGGQTVEITLIGQALEAGLVIEPQSNLVENHLPGDPLPDGFSGDESYVDVAFYVTETYQNFIYYDNVIDSVLLARDYYLIPTN